VRVPDASLHGKALISRAHVSFHPKGISIIFTYKWHGGVMQEVEHLRRLHHCSLRLLHAFCHHHESLGF
jgi:hypothetical protein